jgi:signal peptidase I
MMNQLKPSIIWLAQVGLMIGGGLLFSEYVFQLSRVPTGSMKNTIKVGDYIVANNMKDSVAEVERGDIVTFYSTQEVDKICTGKQNVKKSLYVKRLIGKPGDVINVIDGVVKVNNNILDEDYVAKPNRKVFWGQVVVPSNHMVVFGDNRTESCDSSYFGFVPTVQLKGEVVGVINLPGPMRKVLSVIFRFEHDDKEVVDDIVLTE